MMEGALPPFSVSWGEPVCPSIPFFSLSSLLDEGEAGQNAAALRDRGGSGPWPGLAVDSRFPPSASPQAGPFSPLHGAVSESAQPMAGCRRNCQRHRCWGLAEEARPVAMEREMLCS